MERKTALIPGRTTMRTKNQDLVGRLVVVALMSLSIPALYGRGKPVLSSIQGEIASVRSSGQKNILIGAAVTLTKVSSPAAPITTESDAVGHYEFPGLAPATYRLEVKRAGFKTFTETIVLRRDELHLANVDLQFAPMIEKVVVHGQASGVSQQSAAAPARLTQKQMLDLPTLQQKFTAVLPLIPSVIRTPDGELNFKGTSESNGILLLDSTELVDPVTGQFSIGVPMEAIGSVAVNETPYNAEYGGFSGGVTRIQTVPPSALWHYQLMDFIPGIRGKSGQMVGIADWQPRVTFGGPVLGDDKLSFSESFAYDKLNVPIRGLAWPHDETQTQGINSFTNVQAILSPRHLLSANVDLFPIRTQFADISALVPQTASPNDGQQGVSTGVTDSYQFASGALLSTVFRYTRFDSNAYGQGAENMLITPEGWGGNFFNAWKRDSNQFELLPTVQLPEKSWLGHHTLSFGADFTNRSYGGTSVSHPIDLLSQDGTLAETISFQPQAFLEGHDTEAEEFVEDHWALSQRAAVDLGGRMTSQEEGRPAAGAPRAGVVLAPDRDQKTVIRAGVGLFYDRVPLLATDFNQNPDEAVTFFNPAGIAIGPAQIVGNECVGSGLPSSGVLPSCSFDSAPRNFTWNMQVEREVRPNLMLRVGYLYSQTQDTFVVNSLQSQATRSFFALSPTGGSRYDDVQLTVHYAPAGLGQINVSYIYSQARGNLNALSDLFVPFETPVIRPDAVADLNSDVPNRVVGWGQFHLPWHLTFAPVVDVHSGFPYSNVDVLDDYVGEPNGQRFPTFFSLDVRVYREFALPIPFVGSLKKHKMRFGVYSINVTNHLNPLDVFNSVASPDFGDFVGYQHRIDGLVIDFVQ
jgi:hypothetical protein